MPRSTSATAKTSAALPVGLYLRISDDRMGDELGVRRQEKLGLELAKTRGWDVVNTYVDNDVSAYNGKRRPAYEELLSDLKAGKIRGVVAYHPDRLYRHPRDLERFVETVEAAGAHVATVTAGEIDLSTASGRMVARMLGAAARYESEHKAERQRAKHAELAAAGKGKGGGTRPFGFNDDRLTIREDEAELVREAAQRILAGESIRSLYRDWKARGVKSPAGLPWPKVSIRRMLLSPRIAGLRAHRGVVVTKAVWPAIISAEDHEALVSILTAPDRNRHREPVRRKYLLSGGLVLCGQCGAALVARPNDRRQRRYVCSRDHGGCGGCFIMSEPLELFIADAVITAVVGEAFDKAWAGVRAEKESHAAVELAAAERRLEALADSYADGTITVGAYQKATTKLEAHLLQLRETAAKETAGAVHRRLPSGEAALRAWWDGADIEARAEVVRLVIESVTIGPGVRGLNRFDPRRVEIRWRV